MATVQVNTDSDKRRALEGGRYGPGLDHEATVELTEHIAGEKDKAMVNERGMDVSPGYDRECAEGPYFYYNFKIVLDNGGTAFTRAHVKAKQNRAWLKNLGVSITEIDAKNYTYDADDVAPREVKGGVELKPPREDAEGDLVYNGDVKAVFSA